METAILKELLTRFDRANSTEVCVGALLELLGYSVNTEMTLDILHGLFVTPKGKSARTMAILTEISFIWKKMEGKTVEIMLIKEDFMYYWQRVKEQTALSKSRLHFGH